MKQKLITLFFLLLVIPALGVNIYLQKAVERAKMDRLLLEMLLSEGDDDGGGDSQDRTVMKDYTGYTEDCESWIWRDDNGQISYTLEEDIARALEEKGYSVSKWYGEITKCEIVCLDAECSPHECKP